MPTLAELYLQLHLDMTRYPKWKKLTTIPKRVTWEPFGIWNATGYTNMKLNMLTKRYTTKEQLDVTKDRVQRGLKRREVSSVAINLGHNGGEASPLRYQMGQCLSTIVFRVLNDDRQGIVRPLVIWRTVEITRRWIADLVFLNQVFNYVLDGVHMGPVDLMLNVLWFADFNVALAGKWMPFLERKTPDALKKRFVIRPGVQQYRARDISWTLAANAKPLFDKHGNLLPKQRKSDFPLGEWGGKVVTG